MKLILRRLRAVALVATAAFTALVVPASASALTLHIANESGRPASEVFVDIAGEKGEGIFVVPGFVNDEPKALSEIPGGEVTVEKLISGRVYVSYGAPVNENVPFNSPTRFDWAELTVTPAAADVANLTAVNQFGIGMRLTTLGAGGEELESIGSTYANTIFDAMQQIPGGPESTVRGANGEILRVLSPDFPNSSYPLLTEYVHSMAGQTITLHTAFLKAGERTTSEYSGTFTADGSIALTGKTRVEGGEAKAGPPISFEGEQLIKDIYSGDNTPNTFEGAVRRDVLAGFSLGLWGGKYGNNAINFCTNKTVNTLGEYCPAFDVPAFAEARTTPPPFSGPAYEQYAAVINQYSDIYGNPYSDAAKKVQISLNQEQVKTLRLTILPDSSPSPGGIGGGGGGSSSAPSTAAGTPGGSPPPHLPTSQVTFRLAKQAKLAHGKLAVGKLVCDEACGKVTALLQPVRGKGVIARLAATAGKAKDLLVLKPTKAGKRLLGAGKVKRAKLTVTVTQPGHAPAQKQTTLRVPG